MSHHANVTSDWPTYIDPVTKQELSYREEDGAPCLATDGGGVRYPVLKGIPRILKHLDNYAAAFGEQWLRWRSTQLDSFTGTSITRDRMYRCLGPTLLETLWRGERPLHVLEVGCGAGRFTEILLTFPSVRVTSMDLSQAVEANVLNCPQSDSHRVVQADIMDPPFRQQEFDVVVCLGVIQHTPSPEKTIKQLYQQVKPGGYLVIDHYTFEIRRATKITGNLVRPLVKRLPSQRRMQVVEKLVDVFFPVHKAIRGIPFAQQVFSRVSPITTYFHAYPQLPERLQKEWAVLDTHDGLTDWFKHLRSVKDIAATLKSEGAVEIDVARGGIGVEARCRRPA